MMHGRWPNGWGVMDVTRWFESNFEFSDRFAHSAAVRFAHRFGGGDAPASASANSVATDEPHNFVLPNVVDAQPIDEVRDAPIRVLGYLDKALDHEDLIASKAADLVDGHAPFGMKGLDMVFGADSHTLAGLPTGSPADILGIPPVI
jgi:hypothetical protein